MASNNVEVVRRALDAWNRGDLDGALKDMHPAGEVDWSASRGLESGVYRGREQVRRFYAQWLDVFDAVDSHAEEFIEAGDHVVVPMRSLATAREGLTVPVNSTQVFTLRDGKVVRVQLYQDKQSALEAIGGPGEDG
jgi:ketosteroid isomerase-like protein